MAKSKSKMTSKDSARIQSTGDRRPHSLTGRSGFARRAQSAAARNASDRVGELRRAGRSR